MDGPILMLFYAAGTSHFLAVVTGDTPECTGRLLPEVAYDNGHQLSTAAGRIVQGWWWWGGAEWGGDRGRRKADQTREEGRVCWQQYPPNPNPLLGVGT